LTPTDIPGLSGVRAIAAGSFSGCVLFGTGAVRCSDNGGLSRGGTAISVGQSHGCAVTSGGGVKCWGSNDAGQFGDGTTIGSYAAVDVIGFRAAKVTLALISRSVAVTQARIAAIKVSCGTEARCKGTLTLTTSVRGQFIGSPARRVRVRLGSRTFSIAAGSAQAVKVKLTAKAFALLIRMRRLPTQAGLLYQHPAGSAVALTHTLTLSAPRE
jgi:hypothetical protein